MTCNFLKERENLRLHCAIGLGFCFSLDEKLARDFDANQSQWPNSFQQPFENCSKRTRQKVQRSGAHQMEPPSLLISWVNPFPSRFINRTIFFCKALESHECACCLLSFLFFHSLFPLSARETSPGNGSIYKSTRERVHSKGLYGRCRLHVMGSCKDVIPRFCLRAIQERIRPVQN